MDKGDIWEIAPMLGKIPGAGRQGQTPLATGGLLTWPQIAHSGHYRKVHVATSWFGLPGKRDFLFCHIMRGQCVICWLII